MLERPTPGLVPLVERVHARLRPGRMLEPPPRVSFYPYAGGGSTVREREGRLAFRLSDRMQGAPDLVLEGVIGVLLCRFLGLPDSRADAASVRAYRHYLNDERNAGPAPAGRPGRKHIDPVGAHRSLLESYLRVSLDLGITLPRIPTLSWSKTVS
ncbi:MAG: hypothetical protein QOJ26_604, partial [Thermoplasmata archaeon]|nr:hypothetical protein [Thermoplasmata archaeon]